MKKLTAAAALLVLAAGLSGCAQERLAVTDTCAELRAIVAQTNAAPAPPAEDPELAKKTADSFEDLAERGAEPLQEPLELLAAKMTASDVGELTAEEEAASIQLEETCEF